MLQLKASTEEHYGSLTVLGWRYGHFLCVIARVACHSTSTIGHLLSIQLLELLTKQQMELCIKPCTCWSILACLVIFFIHHCKGPTRSSKQERQYKMLQLHITGHTDHLKHVSLLHWCMRYIILYNNCL